MINIETLVGNKLDEIAGDCGGADTPVAKPPPEPKPAEPPETPTVSEDI